MISLEKMFELSDDIRINGGEELLEANRTVLGLT